MLIFRFSEETEATFPLWIRSRYAHGTFTIHSRFDHMDVRTVYNSWRCSLHILPPAM